MKRNIMILMMALAMAAPSVAQNADNLSDRDANLTAASQRGWEFEVKAGVNLGGAAPLGMPREIRKIKSYNPKFNGTIEGDVTKWIGAERRWGVGIGLKFEEKRMETGATVKNYHTEIIQDGDRVAGYFTGYNRTRYSSTDMTIPVTANYRVSNRWKLRGGLFFSYRMDGDFSGYVSDGYLRNDTPTGEKATFDNGSSADYDFSSDMRRFLWGMQVGASWTAYRHFFISADVSYSFSNIFKSDFNTVTFSLHPVYLNIGFGYRF